MFPLWKVPLLRDFIPRQQKAQAAVALIRQTTTELINKCRALVDSEEQVCSPGASCRQRSKAYGQMKVDNDTSMCDPPNLGV